MTFGTHLVCGQLTLRTVYTAGKSLRYLWYMWLIASQDRPKSG